MTSLMSGITKWFSTYKLKFYENHKCLQWECMYYILFW